MSTFTFTGSEVLRYRLYTTRQKTVTAIEQLDDGEDEDKTAPIKRAITAPTDTRQREKMKLIGALRRLMRPRVLPGSILKSVKQASGEGEVETNEQRVWQSNSEDRMTPVTTSPRREISRVRQWSDKYFTIYRNACWTRWSLLFSFHYHYNIEPSWPRS